MNICQSQPRHNSAAGKKIDSEPNSAEKKFQSICEITSDWIWEVNEHGIYTYSNPKVEDILGYLPEEIIGKRPFDLMPKGEAVKIADIFKKITKSKKSFSGLVNVNLHKTGRKVVLETSGVPIFDSAGSLKGFRGIDRDITRRKQLEDDLLKAHDQLAQKVEERTRELKLTNDDLKAQVKKRQQIGKQLKKKAEHLREMNTALKVLLKERNKDQRIIEKRLLSNIRQLIWPYIDKLAGTRLTDRQIYLLDILRSNLEELQSAYGAKLASDFANLTQTELKVVNLVKLGKSTQEIADVLGISYKTAETHRFRIRKKLGLTNQKTNLGTFISSIA